MAKHNGMIYFSGKHYYILDTDRVKVTDKVAELFVNEFVAHRGIEDSWRAADESSRQQVIKNFKYGISRVTFEIKKTRTGGQYLYIEGVGYQSITTIPESYWLDQVVIFFEEFVEEVV